MAYQTMLGGRNKRYGNDKGMSCLYVVGKLFRKNFSPKEKIRLLIPLLLHGDDPISQVAAWGWMEDYEIPLYEAGPDYAQWSRPDIYFKAYLPYISEDLESANEETKALVDYLFQRHPPATLEALLLRAWVSEEEKESLLVVNLGVQAYFPVKRKKPNPPHSGPTAAQIKQLERLCDGEPWWLEIYLAEVIRQAPTFRSESIVYSLEDSRNRYVKLSLNTKKLQDAHGIKPPVARHQIFNAIERAAMRAEKAAAGTQ